MLRSTLDLQGLSFSYRGALVLLLVTLILVSALIIGTLNESNFPTSINNTVHVESEDFANPAEISIDEKSVWGIRNLYLYRKNESPFLKSDAFVLIPKSNQKPVLSREIKIPTSGKIKIGFSGRNAALLINQPAVWLHKDCAESEVTLEITPLSSSEKSYPAGPIYKNLIVDNRLETDMIKISRFQGEKVRAQLKLRDMNNCGIRKNEAFLVEKFFIKKDDTSYNLLNEFKY